MRVIIWGINYAPEPTGISPYTTDLADHLHGCGVNVQVVTGFAYYPAWEKLSQDRGQLFRTERINGVPVHRCWQYVPRKLNTLKRVLHEATFGVSSLLRALFLPRADVYVVISPPLGLGVVAWIVSRLKRSRYLFHVQDLQPDSAAGLGMVKAGGFLRFMYACERFAYDRAAGVSGISMGMMDAFANKGVPAQKVFLLPNWLRGAGRIAPPASEMVRFREEHQVPAGALLAVYSGNLGRKQGLDVLLDAAEILAGRANAGRPIVLIVAGDGADQASLSNRLKRNPLPNLRLLPLQSAANYQVMLRAADVALVTQMPGTGQVCFPSKLLSVLSAGLPVITTADDTSDLARAVREGGFGINVAAASPGPLAAALETAASNPALLEEWRAKTQWVERFSPEAMLPKFVAAIRAVANPGHAEEQPALETLPQRMNSR
jgi:colanic acid biosynthesis glycosyl transferase WcaI